MNDDDHKAGDDPQQFDPPVPRTLDLIHIILTPFRLKPVLKHMGSIIAWFSTIKKSLPRHRDALVPWQAI